MAEPENLRQLAERILALAMTTEDKELAQLLTTRAGEYLDQAGALEAAVRPIGEAPQHVAQQAEQPQPDDPASACHDHIVTLPE
jgi:hypothetical protein